METSMRIRGAIVATTLIIVAYLLVSVLIINPNVTQPHPLSPVEAASELPSEVIISVELGTLNFTLEMSLYTFEYHSGDRGVNLLLDCFIENLGAEPVGDLCFHKMTIYWANGAANFTTGLDPEMNYTIAASNTLQLELRNSYDWPGVPHELCWSGWMAYGRLLLSFNSNATYILTTALTHVGNMVE